MAKQEIKWYDKAFRFGALALAGVLIFAGIMSIVQGDVVVRYTIGAVIVIAIVRELY